MMTLNAYPSPWKSMTRGKREGWKRERNRGKIREGKKTYHAVELAPFVTQWLSARTARLAGAELAEVLGGAGDDVGAEQEFDAA